jgi:sorbitol/mannitol transport system permease protein
VVLLFLWMIVPLAMTIYFSTLRYNLLAPGEERFAGLENYYWFLTDPAFKTALLNTLLLVCSVLGITVVGGTFLALLIDQQIVGRPIVRLMVIAPFFVMPTVSALVWKNLLMHPVSGLFAWIANSLGLPAVDWFADWPLFSVIVIVAWQWLPFATLILLTALQSLDQEQKEAAEMDGAGAVPYFRYIVLPHLARPITVVILIETIFLLTIFAEILVTGHHRRRSRPADHQPRLPHLLAGAPAVRRRRGFGRRPGGGRARQHRRLLLRPHGRQEPGGLRWPGRNRSRGRRS